VAHVALVHCVYGLGPAVLAGRRHPMNRTGAALSPPGDCSWAGILSGEQCCRQTDAKGDDGQ
jgi:hypothetical protein